MHCNDDESKEESEDECDDDESNVWMTEESEDECDDNESNVWMTDDDESKEESEDESERGLGNASKEGLAWLAWKEKTDLEASLMVFLEWMCSEGMVLLLRTHFAQRIAAPEAEVRKKLHRAISSSTTVASDLIAAAFLRLYKLLNSWPKVSLPKVSAVQISGVESGRGSLINGKYFPVAGETCGKPVYKKENEDVWIEYASSDQWQIKSARNKGTTTCWMASRGENKHTKTVEEVMGSWTAWNTTEQKWETQRYCSVVLVDEKNGLKDMIRILIECTVCGIPEWTSINLVQETIDMMMQLAPTNFLSYSSDFPDLTVLTTNFSRRRYARNREWNVLGMAIASNIPKLVSYVAELMIPAGNVQFVVMKDTSNKIIYPPLHWACAQRLPAQKCGVVDLIFTRNDRLEIIKSVCMVTGLSFKIEFGMRSLYEHDDGVEPDEPVLYVELTNAGSLDDEMAIPIEINLALLDASAAACVEQRVSLREEITGLEQVVAGKKMLQAKGREGQRELEMQLYKLQAIEMEEARRAAGTAEQEAEQRAKDLEKLREITVWLEQAVGDMKRNHSAALAGNEVLIAEMHKAKTNLERKRSALKILKLSTLFSLQSIFTAADSLRRPIALCNIADLIKLSSTCGLRVTLRPLRDENHLDSSPAFHCQCEIIKILVRNGASVKATNDSAPTPLTVALDHEQPLQLIRLLVSRMNDSDMCKFFNGEIMRMKHHDCSDEIKEFKFSTRITTLAQAVSAEFKYAKTKTQKMDLNFRALLIKMGVHFAGPIISDLVSCVSESNLKELLTFCAKDKEFCAILPSIFHEISHTPLDLSSLPILSHVENANLSILTLLLEKRASPNNTNDRGPCPKGQKGGLTPLHAAVSKGTDFIKILIEARADCNVQGGSMDNTPLHDACWLQDEEKSAAIVGLMLRVDSIDLSAKNKRKKTAADICKHARVRTMLLEYSEKQKAFHKKPPKPAPSSPIKKVVSAPVKCGVSSLLAVVDQAAADTSKPESGRGLFQVKAVSGFARPAETSTLDQRLNAMRALLQDGPLVLPPQDADMHSAQSSQQYANLTPASHEVNSTSIAGAASGTDQSERTQISDQASAEVGGRSQDVLESSALDVLAAADAQQCAEYANVDLVSAVRQMMVSGDSWEMRFTREFKEQVSSPTSPSSLLPPPPPPLTQPCFRPPSQPLTYSRNDLDEMSRCLRCTRRQSCVTLWSETLCAWHRASRIEDFSNS